MCVRVLVCMQAHVCVRVYMCICVLLFGFKTDVGAQCSDQIEYKITCPLPACPKYLISK